MEHYFKALNIKEELAKMHTVSLHLTDDAMLWWRCRCVEIEKGLCTIDTWEALKKEIKSQFYPENIKFLKRKSLRQLKHKGSVNDYGKSFTRLMLGISNMTKEAQLFFFLDGLQP